jgi:hypothetical protein
MLIQKFHPGIQLGRQPTLVDSGNRCTAVRVIGTAAAPYIVLRWRSHCSAS